MMHNDADQRRRWQTWAKRLGTAGFLFFLVKGLLWLTAAAVLVLLGIEIGTK
jgi:hypothetical protein